MSTYNWENVETTARRGFLEDTLDGLLLDSSPEFFPCSFRTEEHDEDLSILKDGSQPTLLEPPVVPTSYLFTKLGCLEISSEQPSQYSEKLPFSPCYNPAVCSSSVLRSRSAIFAKTAADPDRLKREVMDDLIQFSNAQCLRLSESFDGSSSSSNNDEAWIGQTKENLASLPKWKLTQERCKCTRSHCLKLYCVCFENHVHCSLECQCYGCLNYRGKPEWAEACYRYFMENQKSPINIRRPCHCSGTTNCLKRYCSCYYAGRPCSQYCECLNCENRH